MKRYLLLTATAVGLFACKPSAVKDDVDKGSERKPTETHHTMNDEVSELDQEKEVKDDVELDNGIKIKWFEHGEGEKLGYGEMVGIDYKVSLEDGKIVDGNHLLNKDQMPFMIGFQMQTKGWDIALQELKVGDFAEIYIPSDLARGEKGITGLIPPNSVNILRIRILERMKPDRVVDGNKVWLFEESPKEEVKFEDGKQIEFHCMASSPSSPFFVNTFRDAKPFNLNLEDYGVVPGLKKALINAKKSDRMLVFVPSVEAYKTKGYQDIVKPNEDLIYNVLVMNVMDQ